jgi:hypothetical protein
MRAVRRVMLMLAVAALCAGAGSALFASSAFAGGVDGNTGILTAAAYNATPYTWTLVDHKSFDSNGNYSSDLQTVPAATISPGGGSLFGMYSNYSLSCFGTWKYGYDAYFTYRVDVVGGPPEYVTVGISQLEVSFPTGCGLGGQHARADVYITTAPPPPGWHPALLTPPGASPANQQLNYTHNVPYLFDQTIGIVGNYTVDASSNLGKPFVDLLNTLCSGTTNTSCSFTQQGPLTWGTGDPGSPFASTHCGSAKVNNTFSVAYTASQSASLTVAGGITATAEFTLFDVVSNSISVSVEASHQWTETASITRQSSVDIPPNDIAHLWVVPVVGKVTGTLVVSNGSATFTATNFSETRSGVAKDALTPAYDVITKVRPMTAAELQQHCPSALSSTLRGAGRGKPPVKLVPGRGVARVSLGQTQAQVARELGRPLRKSFLVNPCQGLDRRCYAVAGTGGRWSYRKLSVVFGPDLRVSALIYRGAQRSARGAGVGSSPPVVRGGYPGASCSRSPRRMNCTLTRAANAGRKVETVFSFSKRSGGLYKCDQVLIYVIDGGRKQVSS